MSRDPEEAKEKPMATDAQETDRFFRELDRAVGIEPDGPPRPMNQRRQYSMREFKDALEAVNSRDLMLRRALSFL